MLNEWSDREPENAPRLSERIAAGFIAAVVMLGTITFVVGLIMRIV
ncbi:hypothetical protein [Sphingobium sp.]|nr:hypothetical protein [Sphingobium sp.]